MAAGSDDRDSTPDSEVCMACRGTGQVTGVVDGERRSVECPWCKGTGRRVPGVDAQAGWEREGPPGGDEPPPAA
jgi:DnaJ-class molecular chaperone